MIERIEIVGVDLKHLERSVGNSGIDDGRAFDPKGVLLRYLK